MQRVKQRVGMDILPSMRAGLAVDVGVLCEVVAPSPATSASKAVHVTTNALRRVAISKRRGLLRIYTIGDTCFVYTHVKL
jgi:hypothetical protein